MGSQHLRGHYAKGVKMQNVSAASFARGHKASVSSPPLELK